jgi:hypothetical protein
VDAAQALELLLAGTEDKGLPAVRARKMDINNEEAGHVQDTCP